MRQQTLADCDGIYAFMLCLVCYTFGRMLYRWRGRFVLQIIRFGREWIRIIMGGIAKVTTYLFLMPLVSFPPKKLLRSQKCLKVACQLVFLFIFHPNWIATKI